MSSYMKAGAEDFRKMRDEHKAHADSVDNLKKKVEHMLGTTIWEGQAKGRFEDEWRTTYSPTLTKLSEGLRARAQELDSRAKWTDDFEKAGAKAH